MNTKGLDFFNFYFILFKYLAWGKVKFGTVLFMDLLINFVLKNFGNSFAKP